MQPEQRSTAAAHEDADASAHVPETGSRAASSASARGCARRCPRRSFRRSFAVLLPLAAAFVAPGCALVSQPLDGDPWENADAGTHSLGVSSGWALYEAEVRLQDRSGTPDLGSGSDTTDLDPTGGVALKYQYFLNSNVALGAIVEQRTFDPDVVRPLSSDIDGDDYTTYHYLLSSRFFTDPLGEDGRWKAFLGADLGYVDQVELDATVTYAPGFVERVTLNGDSYFTLGLVGGLSYLISDHISFEFGAFYEWPLDSSDDTLVLNIPDGLGGTNPNNVDGQVYPEGLIGFLTLTYYL
jgi:hypothetical protein